MQRRFVCIALTVVHSLLRLRWSDGQCLVAEGVAVKWFVALKEPHGRRTDIVYPDQNGSGATTRHVSGALDDPSHPVWMTLTAVYKSDSPFIGAIVRGNNAPASNRRHADVLLTCALMLRNVAAPGARWQASWSVLACSVQR
jgi:hypothetical protein